MDDQLVSYQVCEPPLLSHIATPHVRGDATQLPIAGILNEIDYGLVIIGESGEIALMNRLAHAEFDTRTCIRVRNQKLAGYSARSTLAIERAILEARCGHKQIVEIAAGADKIALSFGPVAEAIECPSSANSAYTQWVLVSIGKRTPYNTGALAEFARSHGLTAAEQRLLPRICEGASIKDMARQLKVSPCTIRIQLKTIRQKTGAASLRPLMLQLLTLPPVRSAYGH